MPVQTTGNRQENMGIYDRTDDNDLSKYVDKYWQLQL